MGRLAGEPGRNSAQQGEARQSGKYRRKFIDVSLNRLRMNMVADITHDGYIHTTALERYL